MGLTLDALAQTRPFLYHLTATKNLARIRTTRELESAARLAQRGDVEHVLASERAAAVEVPIDGHVVSLRDQAPLHAGNVDFRDDWTFERLLAELNARVFFWPGTVAGPIPYGIRHYERYRDEEPAILRVPTASMPTAAEACRFNSGSPRCSGGLGSPRGTNTFQPMDQFALTPSRVVEVTWRDAVRLPEAVWVGGNPAGPWAPL